MDIQSTNVVGLYYGSLNMLQEGDLFNSSRLLKTPQGAKMWEGRLFKSRRWEYDLSISPSPFLAFLT